MNRGKMMKKICLYIVCLVFVAPLISFAGTPGTQKWAFTTGDWVRSSPAIGADGTSYAGSYDNKLYAINPNGTQKWTFTIGSYVESSPAIGADGTIYVGSNDDKKLYAINPNGTQKWAFTTGDDVYSSPAIGVDGTIYVGSWDKKLYAINPNGTQKWAFTIGSYVQSSPAIGADGTIYVGSNDDHKLYAINPNGTQKWAFTTGNSVCSSPAIGADGTIYVGSYDNKLYAINPNGTQKWAFTTGSSVYSSPAIGVDGTIYVGSWDKKLYAINPNGTQKWAFTIGSSVYSSPAIGADGTIYVGSEDNKLYAINPNGTQKWAFTTGNSVYSSPAIGADGTIYVGSEDDKLYAIYSDSMGLAQSPWAKHRANSMNTGLSSGTSGGSLSVSDEINFAFFNAGGTIQKALAVINTDSQSLTITSCIFGHSAFLLESALPLSLPVGTSSLKVNIRPTATGLYKSSMQLTYQIRGESKTISIEIKAGLFAEDGGETAFTAHQALTAYNDCYAANADSAATRNNLGILYRLLGDPPTAENYLMAALSDALNSKYGYTGIKMNVGVVKSDQNIASQALNYYDLALTDVSSTTSQSVLAPQIYYNKAWELFKSLNYTDSLNFVNMVLSHQKTNNILRAKALILRGAIYFRQGSLTSANSDFKQAQTLDPNGPIGRLAQYNLTQASGRMVTINGGVAYTTNPTVTLTLSAPDPSGITEMKFSNNNITWSPAETYVTTKAWTLSSGNGAKTVYVKFKDGNGNWSGAVTATITLGSRPPTALYFPHVDTSLPWQTEIAIINTNDQTVNGTLRGISDDGQLIETKDINLFAHGRRQIIIADEFINHTDIGYIAFDTDSAAVRGYTKFYQAGIYRAAIPAVTEVNSSDIDISHIDSSAQWWTGVSLVNTTSTTKTLTITFNNGLSVPYTLNANEHKAFTIGSLLNQPIQPDIRSAVITNASGVIGLELFGSIGSGNQMDGLLLTDKIASTIYYPHVDSNGWWTGIVAYNPSESACTIIITPYSIQGTPLSPSTLSIAGKGKYIGMVTDLDLPAQTAWFKIDSTSPITGFELFGTADGNQLAAYAGGGGTGAKTGVFPKIEKYGGWTGIAFVNTEADAASVTLNAYSDAGGVVATQVLPPLGSYAKVVKYAEEIFTQDISSATYITYSSDRNVVGFQLNGSSDGMMLDGLPALAGTN